MMKRSVIIAFAALSLFVCSIVLGAGSVDGLIKKDTVPQNGVEVKIRSTAETNYVMTVHTDGNGFFALTNIPMGHFTVTLFDKSQAVLAQKEAEILAVGDSVTINFQIE